MTWPNKVTVFRLILIPLFMLAFAVPFSGHYMVAAALFAIAALSDLLDGFLARLLRQESAFGRFLDPVADKLMVAVAMVMLLWYQPQLVLAVPVAIIVCREIAVSALREWMAEVGSRIDVSAYGKAKTVAQMFSIFFLIASADELFLGSVQRGLLWWVGMVLLYVATAMTLWSMLLYLRASWPELYGSGK